MIVMALTRCKLRLNFLSQSIVVSEGFRKLTDVTYWLYNQSVQIYLSGCCTVDKHGLGYETNL